MIEVQRYLQGQVADERFPLIQFLGGTEHSCVFLTECAGSERAAIKLIPAPAGNTEPLLTRWRLAARFSHPHLLRIYDAGRCTVDGADMLYVVMEYAEENLAETLIQRPLSPAETSDLLHPLLDVLGYIHGKGFVHGHVQPSNIMAIGDRLALSSDRICRIGELPERRNGNAPYCAPECGTESLSTAGDIWSLGITIVECLTERLPQVEDSRGGVSLPADLPPPFLELVRHCLTKSPQRRWDVAALKTRLQLNSFALEEAPAAPASTPSPTPARAVRRAAPTRPKKTASKHRRSLALTAGGVAIAAVVLGVVFLRPRSHAKQAPAQSVKIESVTPTESRVAESRPAESPVARPKIAPAKEQPVAKTPPRPKPQPRVDSARESSAAKSVADAAAPVPPRLAAAAPLAQSAVVHRALPDVPRFASSTIRGTVRVRVRVKVNPAGNVSAAELDWPGPSRYFARLSMNAARNWKFRPPDANAQAAASEWLIRFDFTRSATTAAAKQQSR
jgi:TonB family protein